MKFIQVDQFGGPEQLKLREEATPVPARGQLLVEVKASGINFADLTARSGHYATFSSAPFRPGFEVAGTVAGVGEGVSNFAIGQRVMAVMQGGGGYASHATVEANMAVPLPDNLDFAPATALLVQGLTAYFLLEAGQLKPGGTVLVPGAAGGVGSLAVQIAKLKGAGKVIGLASPSKHAKVCAYGADDVFDYNRPGWSKQVLAATGGKGVDIYLDSQGELWGEGAHMLGKGAFWLMFGRQARGDSALDAKFMGLAKTLTNLIFSGVTIRSYWLNSDVHRIGEALPELIGWAASGKLCIEADNRFALEDAAKAHEAIAARQTSGKVVLEP
jgi:NADPH2:quinone reductase